MSCPGYQLQHNEIQIFSNRQIQLRLSKILFGIFIPNGPIVTDALWVRYRFDSKQTAAHNIAKRWPWLTIPYGASRPQCVPSQPTGMCWVILIRKVRGANVGPTWGRHDPGGPRVGPMNFAIWDDLTCSPVITYYWCNSKSLAQIHYLRRTTIPPIFQIGFRCFQYISPLWYNGTILQLQSRSRSNEVSNSQHHVTIKLRICRNIIFDLWVYLKNKNKCKNMNHAS